MTGHFADLSKEQIGFHTHLATGGVNCPVWERPQSTFCPAQADCLLLLLQATHFSNHLFAVFMSLWVSPSYLTQVCHKYLRKTVSQV